MPGRRWLRFWQPRRTVAAVPLVKLESEGVILIYGCDERAVEAGNLLKDQLDVTVLLKPPAASRRRAAPSFRSAKGTIRTAKGHLGAFEITVDDFAQPAPSSRGELVFGPSRNGAKSQCDIILDLSGGTPLFPAADLRDGYLRADPRRSRRGSQGGAEGTRSRRHVREAALRHLRRTISARIRARASSAARRCLDLCPTGAIAPAGNHVAIDAHICAGCGQCAAACPTGAAAYALPPADALMRKLRTLLLRPIAMPAASSAIVLFHDEAHGAPLIDALARFGDGLPANVLPLAVNEVTQVGLETHRRGLRLRRVGRALPAARPAAARRHRTDADDRAGETDPARARLRRRSRRNHRDRRSRCAGRRACAPSRRCQPAPRPATFMPAGAKRGLLRFALRELHRAAPEPVDVVAAARARAVRLGGDRCRRAARSAWRAFRPAPPARSRDDPERPTAALRRGCLRAMRAVQGDLSGEGHHAQTAARFPRRDRVRARAQGGAAVLLHPLRQAVRREEHDRARGREARRQALDVHRRAQARSTSSRCATTAASPSSRSRISIPMARRRAPRRAPPRTICASGGRGEKV